MKSRKRALSFVILAALVMTLFTQWSLAADTSDKLTARETAFLDTLDYDNAESLGRYLTEEIGNRIAYSPRRDMAADWIIGELESYGYKPYIHEFTYGNPTRNGLLWIDGQHYAYYGPTWAANTVYQYDSRDELKISGATVLNWQNQSQPFVMPADADVAGKAVFVAMHTTGTATAATMPSAANAYNAALVLQNAGAEAVIFQTPPAAASGNTTYSRIGNTTTGTAITIPVGSTLNYETAGIVDAMNDDTAVSITMYASNQGKNVVAVLPSFTGCEKTVYITSHYDTMSSGPGMNDNGSGTLMTMEMARAFKDWKFEYNLVFILFDNEEGGLRGAYAYCEAMTQEERANFVANYNMDMISTSQEDCIHFFLNISDTRLRTFENPLTNTQRLIDVPEALEIAKEYDVFNHSYLAAQKTGFDMSKFNICFDTTTDHYAFVRYGNGNYDNHINMMNAVEYDWRRNEKGTSFETLYHKAGDSYAINFSRERLEMVGNIVALAIYYSAFGDMTYLNLASSQAPSFVIRKNMITQIQLVTNAESLTFTSSNPAIATVTQNGVVTGKSIGVAVIQIRDTDSNKIINVVINCTN